MNLPSAGTRRFTSRGIVCLLALPLLVPAASAAANQPGPGGVNIGFNFNWSPGPSGYTASFIATVSGSGGTLNTCAAICNFAFTYSIGGVAQTPVAPDGNYQTWTLPPGSGRGCDVPQNTSPLTLFNCFNSNSFGQDFQVGTTGALTAFTMPMTCLNPAGTAPVGLVALIYQITGATIPATPLATTPVDLSTCPTLTNWTGHTFVAGDFVSIPINFSGVNLTSGNTYGVFFSGLAPGTPPPGAPAAPTVTAVTPGSGPTAGGNTVTITGAAFTGATSVTFGGTAALSFNVVNDTTISAAVPAGASGPVSVLVTTPNGTNSANTLYTYVIPTPTLSESGMIALAILLALSGWLKLRQREQTAVS